MPDLILTSRDLVLLLTGLTTGVLAGVVLWLWSRAAQRRLALAMLAESRRQWEEGQRQLHEQTREAFGTLALDALRTSSRQLMDLAGSELQHHSEKGAADLDAKKRLIDQTLTVIHRDLQEVQTVVAAYERDREAKFGALDSQLKGAGEQTARLTETTEKLRAALTSPIARGAWGERMAEDVLRAAGLQPGIHYVTQTALPSGVRPDFTFLLPRDRVVHMDVKFPLDNYLRWRDAAPGPEQDGLLRQFLRDARNRIREAAARGYIDPAGGTLDLVLVLVPVEAVFAFLNERDPGLLDDALKAKVVLCSPVTLYAVVTLLRQAVENFHLERTASDLLRSLGRFEREWRAYTEAFAKLGDRIQQVQAEYDALATTRTRQLDRALQKLDAVRQAGAAGSDPEGAQPTS